MRVGLIAAALFTSVVLHEFGHAFAARMYGIGTASITLYPFGGIAAITRQPTKPSEELVIALAGQRGCLARHARPVGRLHETIRLAIGQHVLDVGRHQLRQKPWRTAAGRLPAARYEQAEETGRSTFIRLDVIEQIDDRVHGEPLRGRDAEDVAFENGVEVREYGLHLAAPAAHDRLQFEGIAVEQRVS